MTKFVFSAIFLLLIVPSAISQGTENLKIDWPAEYKFKVGSDQNDGPVHMVEMIPEKETLEKWTLMGTTMSIQGAQAVPSDTFMNLMYDQAKQNSDNAKLTFIEKSAETAEPQWILFKIEASSFKNDKNPESQLYYVVKGKTALYSNLIAAKEPKLDEKFIEKWTKVFKSSRLIN